MDADRPGEFARDFKTIEERAAATVAFGVEREDGSIEIPRTDAQSMDGYPAAYHRAVALRIARARGFAWTAIARTLNEKGYKNKYGRPITDVMVAGIVRNEAYKGVYAFGHVRVEGGLPRIVADAEWDAARRAKEDEREAPQARLRQAGNAVRAFAGGRERSVSIIGTNNYPIALPYLAQDKLAPHGVCETTSVGYSHVVSVVSVRDERPRFARTARNVNVRDPLGILHDSQRLSYKHDQSFLSYLQGSIVDHDCTCKHVHYVKPFICTC